MFPPPPPSSSSPFHGLLETNQDEQRKADIIQQTNFRSVTRNDPSVQEILGTSVYSVIYLYDEAAGAWEKQKQEGPLFVVRRDKAPEYALYMLNRQAVKNVTLPLVPGEMKLTVVDASTLQVARRGDKVRRGIWFSEGSEVVEKFRQVVLRICGEPSKRPGGTASPAPAPAVPFIASDSVATATPPSDGLSRLFAGLTTAPGVGTPPISAPPAPAALNSVRAGDRSYSPFPVPRAYHSPAPPSAPEPYTHTPSEPVSQPPLQPPPAPSPLPAPGGLVSAPGQTVDDLLNSILGIASPVPAPPQPVPGPLFAQAPISAQQAPLAQQPLAATTDMPFNPLGAASAQAPVPNPNTSSRVGNASFAQAAGSTSPNPPTPFPNLVTHLDSVVPHHVRSDAASPAAGIPVPTPKAPQGQPPSQHRSQQPPPTAPNGPGQQIPGAPMHPMVDALSSAAQHQIPNGGIRAPNESNEVGKRMFVQDMLHLLHTDPQFIDDVWAAFLQRTQGGRK